MSINISDKSNFIWKIADILRGDYKQHEYADVILPFTVLKRLDSVLIDTHDEVVKLDNQLTYKNKAPFLCKASGYKFYNTSEFTFAKLKDDPNNLDENIVDYIKGFSDNAREILEAFNIYSQIERLEKEGLLYLIVSKFSDEIDLHPDRVSNTEMGYIFEELIRKFSEMSNETAGEHFTPREVIRLMVAILFDPDMHEITDPSFMAKLYDPAAGAGGMFVQSAKFVQNHQGRANDLSIYGQESNANTWKLAQMNLAIHGLEGDLGSGAADTFFKDLHPDMRADFIIANPPFNLKDWGGDRLVEDKRWKYGLPPNGNANYAWMQHMIYHLSDVGKMGLVLANGSLSSSTGTEAQIRENIIKDDLVECIIAMPDRLFYSTGISVSLWIINKAKAQKNKTLFLDCRSLGHMVDRAHRDLAEADIEKIATTYHKFTEGKDVEEVGFAYVAETSEIDANSFVLTPGRYVGLEEEEEDNEPFEEKMERLAGELKTLFEESNKLEKDIKTRLGELGYGI